MNSICTESCNVLEVGNANANWATYDTSLLPVDLSIHIYMDMLASVPEGSLQMTYIRRKKFFFFCLVSDKPTGKTKNKKYTVNALNATVTFCM